MAIGGDLDGVLADIVAGDDPDPEGLSIRLATPARFSSADCEPLPLPNDAIGAVRSTRVGLVIVLPLVNEWEVCEDGNVYWPLEDDCGEGFGEFDERKALSFSDKRASSSSGKAHQLAVNVVAKTTDIPQDMPPKTMCEKY